MKNPFTPNLMRHIEALLRGSGYDEETIEYAAHAINQHEKLVELLRLAGENLEDDLEERPMRHSLGNLTARIKALLDEEKP